MERVSHSDHDVVFSDYDSSQGHETVEKGTIYNCMD